MEETQVSSLGWEDPVEKGVATHSSFLAWRIPWTEEPHGLESTGSQRVRHNCVPNTSQPSIGASPPLTRFASPDVLNMKKYQGKKRTSLF